MLWFCMVMFYEIIFVGFFEVEVSFLKVFG